MLDYIRERIERIHGALREDPLALKEPGRTAGEAILWNLMTLTDATSRLSEELKSAIPRSSGSKWAAFATLQPTHTTAFNQNRSRPSLPETYHS